MSDQKEEEIKPVSFKPYALDYSKAFSWTLIALVLFNSFIFKLPAPTGLLITIICTSVVANKFTNDHQRLFTKNEKRHFAITSTLLNILLTTVFIGLFAASALYHSEFQNEIFTDPGKAAPGLLAGIFTLAVLLQYIAHSIFYGMFNKTMLKQVQQQIGCVDKDKQ